MNDCKYYIDEICVNADCPYRADYCPVTEYPNICKYYADKRAEKDDYTNLILEKIVYDSFMKGLD